MHQCSCVCVCISLTSWLQYEWVLESICFCGILWDTAVNLQYFPKSSSLKNCYFRESFFWLQLNIWEKVLEIGSLTGYRVTGYKLFHQKGLKWNSRTKRNTFLQLTLARKSLPQASKWAMPCYQCTWIIQWLINTFNWSWVPENRQVSYTVLSTCQTHNHFTHYR